MKERRLVIIGGGPAGLAAAVAAYDEGERDILILERENELGGILNQCIHNGFGLHRFKEELTGPEYADRYIQEVFKRNIEYRLQTMVLNITSDRVIDYVNETEGYTKIKAGAIILACGCRERPRGAINIAGTRPAGIFSAGTAQRLVNIDGYLPGKEVVILGSGDIGLIMARRMTYEGAKVKAVVELMPYSSGLNRNIVQCLEDYDIPLLFSHTVIDIKGSDRVTGVVIAEVDSSLRPIPETAKEYSCDTLLLSVGLIPENELARNAEVELSAVTGGAVVDENMMTSVKGVFAAGNVLHVHDLVDYVSEESAHAARSAVKYLNDVNQFEEKIAIKSGNGIRYTVPQLLNGNADYQPLNIRMRVDNVYRNARIVLKVNDEVIYSRKRQIMTPGEMESLNLADEIVEKMKNSKNVVFEVEAGK
ncbi:MAG TPA: FAD-dependent oxidoreductase [Acholeplasmataceae bacterium]|jgi:NADPH-dependent 2,4-dienoyl-CoA reductase/sulfur reductase-like enzyme|nr:FAD-dependent oxidoreductase [Acholeplasmataceae bacterium]